MVVTGAGSELARRLAESGYPSVRGRWTAGLDPRVVPATLGALKAGGALLHAHDAHAVTLAGIAARIAGTPSSRRDAWTFPSGAGFWGRADRVIAISGAVADVLRADGIPPERITVIPSGISLDDARAAVPLGISRTGSAARIPRHRRPTWRRW